jgi:hypothetical protein
VRDLARRQGGSLVSCYVPFARTGKDVRQNTIHLKNCQRAIAAARANEQVDAVTTARAAVELSNAARAVEDPHAPRSTGIAMFATPEESVTLESPLAFAPLVTVGPRFYLLPLLPCTAVPPPVHVLALSRHSVRLVDVSTAQELPLPAGVPRSLTDTVGTERKAPSLHQHSVGMGSVFHGHGEGEDDVLPEIETFCRRIAHALTSAVDRTRTTLLLAGDVHITAVFRRVASAWQLLEQQVYGSHDRTGAAELAALAEPLVAARQSASHADLRARYGARTADHRASDDPVDIAAAARAGRIDTLLLDAVAALDEPRRRAAREPHATQPEGPFNNEAVLTLRCGGEVRLVASGEMPTGAPQAAIYRF